MRGLATDKIESLTFPHLSLRFHDATNRLCHIMVSFRELLLNDLISLADPVFLSDGALRLS